MNINPVAWKRRFSVRKSILTALAVLAAGLAGYFLMSFCINSTPRLAYAYGRNVPPARHPPCRFAVISDMHYYDVALGAEGGAFEECLAGDRMLFRESAEILDLALEKLLQSGVRFLLVPGDLTKDGERVNHERVAAAFARLEEGGIKVYVTPGNHDINNAWACSYSGSVTSPVATVTAAEFERIYEEYGYGEAIHRDSNSLSYVAEPVDGLWIVSLDDCRYRENRPGEQSILSGRISQETETWLEGALREANESHKAVIVLMHHGVVEHWRGQRRLHPDFLVEDCDHFSAMLASWGVRLAFTGHYHAQDVAMRTYGRGFLLDVETGSLAAFPCPVRLCEIDDGQNFSYRTQKIAGELRPGTDFVREEEALLRACIVKRAKAALEEYNVDGMDADAVAGCVGAAFVAHFAGDENPASTQALDMKRFRLWSRVVLGTQRYVLDGLWNDAAPGDNDGVVSLLDGE